MALRDLDIEVDLDVDVSDLLQASAQIDMLIAQLSAIDTDLDINVNADLALVRQQMEQLRQQMNEIDRNDIDIDVNTRATEALLELQRLDQQIRTLDHEDIFFNVDLEDASGEILRLRTLIRTLEQDVDIEVDTAGAHAQIAALQAHLLLLRGPDIDVPIPNMGGGLGGFGLLEVAMTGTKLLTIAMALPLIASTAQVAVGALGTLGVALGVVGGGALSLVSALGVAAVGLGSFGLTAIPLITKLYDENAKLTDQQKYLKGGIDMMTGSWRELQKSLEYVTFQSIESGLHSMIAGMRVMEPIMYNANKAVGGLFVNLENAIRGEKMTAFFEYLERSVEPLTLNIGNGLGNMVGGIANLMVALEPLTSWMGAGFEGMMERFSNWTFNLQGSEKMTAFIDYVKAELPKIGDILGGATDGITGFFAAFDVTASDGLSWMVETMQDFADWSANLDTNDGFQNMLSAIKNDGPVVAGIIGDVAEKFGGLVTTLSNLGRGEDGEGGLLSFFSKLGSGETLLQNLTPAGWLGSTIADWLTGGNKDTDIDINVDANVDKAEQKVHDVTTKKRQLALEPETSTLTNSLADLPPAPVPLTAGNIDINPDIPAIDVPATASTVDVNRDIPPLDVQANANKVDVTATVPPVEVKATASSVDTTRLGPVKLPIDLTGTSGAAKFTWPPMPKFTFPELPKFSFPELPKFSWPTLPKWSWPAMPKFSWPAYPKFSWPPMPTVTVNVSGGSADGSHSSGLGRVPFDGYIGELHKDEAVLTASQADDLRSMGVLQGDGAAPVVNTAPLVSTVSTATTTTNVSRSASKVDVGGVQIIVQGGNTNEETASVVQTALVQLFDTLSDIFPEVQEG